MEGPWLMYREGIYYLFYSANSYKGPNYRMNVATSTNVTGPYEKYEIPVVQTDWDRCKGQHYIMFELHTFPDITRGLTARLRARGTAAWWWTGPGPGGWCTTAGGEARVSSQYVITHLVNRYGREGGRRMLLDRLEWHGLPGLVTYPRVEGAVPSDQEREDPI